MAEAGTQPIATRRPFSVRKMTGFTAVAVLCFTMLYAPLVPLVAYSFNSGSSIALWEGLSWRWYEAAWRNDLVQDAAFRSLLVATLASSLATSLATMAALG
ncbi:MAG: ABC transporter permease, partial [Aestuariivirgaceae bacterium]